MSDRIRQVLTELLVLRAQTGQQDAMGLLIRHWHERLWRHAKRSTGTDDGADDVMQQAWLDICRGLNGLDDPSRFGPWVYRIVTRGCAHWVRKRQRVRRVHQEWMDQHSVAREMLDDAERIDAADAVRTALRGLPAEQQAILELRYVENFGIEQIATALGIAAGTVKSRLYHAREELREHILKVTQ